MRRMWVVAAMLIFAFQPGAAHAQETHTVRLGVVNYGGGGDWYEGITPMPHLINYVRQYTAIDVAPEAEVVELTHERLFTLPFIFLTGHGNVVFSDTEARRLRRYLENGGFLYIDDDYGLDPYIRREMKKVFPEQDFVELPFSHGIYSAHYSFPNGLPKIHEHDGKPAQGFGLFHNGRLVVYYTYETNISDGWESEDVHGNPPEVRAKALQMGVNILTYALMN